jgi:hypothetical protein
MSVKNKVSFPQRIVAKRRLLMSIQRFDPEAEEFQPGF